MNIKNGIIVSHSGALEWGVGKVTNVASNCATIQFSDGKSRKIAASHYMTLLPGDAASYVAPATVAATDADRPAPKAPRKKKVVAKTA